MRTPDVPTTLAARLQALRDALAKGRTDTDLARAAAKPGAARDRYEDLGEIAHGGMGAVYKMKDADLKRTVAMKLILNSPADGTTNAGQYAMVLDRFIEEAQVTGQLDHPGVVPLHELGIDPAGQVYFTMRLVNGHHLGKIFEMAESGEDGWTQERALRVIVKVCETMAYAHNKGVLHCDLKPANVMAGRFGEVYVMDWGLATLTGQKASNSAPLAGGMMTAPISPSELSDGAMASMFGTPAYMPPEQSPASDEPMTNRSDIYSLGAVLYHLLTGNAPYVVPGEKVRGFTILMRLQEGPPPYVRELNAKAPAELAAICDKAMARDPADRYASMLEMADDIDAYLAGRPVTALPLGATARALRWCRRYPMAIVVLLAVAATAAFGIWRLERLGHEVARQSALQSTMLEAQMLEDINSFYSASVVGRVDRAHTMPSHNYKNEPGAIPIPATFLTDLGEKISENDEGMLVRQYSDHHFAFRKPWVIDDFERRALNELRRDPETPVYSFEDVNGRLSVRYAVGRRMEASCVDCHNAHPDSTKRDWKVGDVRGVLEIVRPVDDEMARMKGGLRSTLLSIAVILLVLVALTAAFGVRTAIVTSRRPKR